jgi:hypothetical protein
LTDLLPLDAHVAAALQPRRDDEDHYCSCGYNLRGLPARRACPECGAPPAPPVGQCLWHADVRWLEQLRLGVVLLLGHYFAFAPATMLFVPLANSHHPCMHVVWLLPQVVLVLGVWRLTSREPGVRTRVQTRADRMNHLTRRLALAWLGFFVLRSFVDVGYRVRNVFPLYDANTTRLDLAVALICVAWTALVALRLASLGRRVNSGMLTYGGAVVWMLIACGVLGDPLEMFLYANGIAGHGVLMELQGTGGVAMFFGSTLTIAFLTWHWIAINLAIVGTTLQLKRAAGARPRPSPHRITCAARVHFAACSTANSDSNV